MKFKRGVVMKFKIGRNIFEVIENGEVFTVYKNGKLANLCAGSEYETESGACYAILNEYAIN